MQRNTHVRTTYRSASNNLPQRMLHGVNEQPTVQHLDGMVPAAAVELRKGSGWPAWEGQVLQGSQASKWPITARAEARNGAESR